MKLPTILGGEKSRSWRSLAGGSGAQLVPDARLSGPMPWVIAIMIALTVIATAGGLALRNMAHAASAELSGGITVQIVEAAPEARKRQAAAALARLKDSPGVVSARIVPDSELAALIEPWLGEGGMKEDAVPVPALLDLRFDAPVSSGQLEALRDTLRQVAPAARIDPQANWLGPVFAAIQSLQWLALVLVVLLALATAAAVLLAARTALGSNRDTIEIVHLLGGTDTQIARIFQRSIALDAVGGGLIGLGLGVAAIILLGRSFAGLGAGMVDGGALGWIDWAALGLLPLGGVLLATITARFAVMRALKRML